MKRVNLTKKIASFFMMLVALSACTSINFERQMDEKNMLEVSIYRTDVIGVNESQLKVNYWLDKIKPRTEPLMSQQEISAFNHQLLIENKHIVKPLNLPAQLSKSTLLHKISAISSVPVRARFYANGKQLTHLNYREYVDNLNEKQVKTTNEVRWGLVVKRSVLRKFPTLDRVFNKGMDTDLDRFQESGIFPGEAVAILHESADQKWYLIQNYNYLAWLPKEAVALGDKAVVAEFIQASEFLLVTGSKVYTAYNPENLAVSQIQLDMGVRLPLMSRANLPNQLYGQNPYSSYVVKLPVRNAQGQLSFSLAMIGMSQDVSRYYLPLTQQNIVNQAFKFLGERYGWGHDYNGRDCTGFVGEVYKSFGFVMPRNSGQQGQGKYGQNIRFTKQTPREEKLAAIGRLAIGDLIYIPGHVMMYLGDDKGEPYVIHDVKGLAYLNAKGELYRGTLNGVSITPLLPLQLSKTTSYVDRIYAIKRLTLIGHSQDVSQR